MDLSNISASLKYGRLLTSKWLKFMYVALAFYVVSVLSIVVLPIIFVPEWDMTVLLCIISISLIFVTLSIFLLYLIISDKKLKNKILLWANDAIELKAYSKTIGKEFNMQPTLYYQIAVSFVVNGTKHTKTSGEGSDSKKHHKIFSQYADREINILYSPKYDEVLVLKDKE